jgi:hypothetical protein
MGDAMSGPTIALGGGGGTDPASRFVATGQSFAIREWHGSGPAALHVHHVDDEAWHVLEGTLRFRFWLTLGAKSGDIRKMIVYQGMRLAVVGVVGGIASAFGLTRFMASFLFGVKAWDPVVFIGIPILLTAVALCAVWFPAGRASRVDPIVALRYE